MISRTLLFAAFVAGSILSASAPAQDVMAVAANHYVVRVDNADVRVIENTLAPGQIDPVHTHPAGWYYVTKPGKMKIVRAGGKSEIWDAKEGEAGWMDAEGPHSSENIGTSTMGFILVEVKSVGGHAAANSKAP